MPIKSNNTKGNPYHDERNGEFTSKDGEKALFDTPDDFLKSFDVDNIDDFLGSFDGGTFDEKNRNDSIISKEEWTSILNSLVTDMRQKDEYVQKITEIYLKTPQDIQNAIFNYLNDSKIPITIKGQITAFIIKKNWFWGTEEKELVFCKSKVFSLNDDDDASNRKKSTFVHEMFHGIDDYFGNVSENYVLSNGKTFRQTFESEIPSTWEGKQKLFQNLMVDFENETQKKIIENGFSQADYLFFKKFKNEEREIKKQLKEERKKVIKGSLEEIEKFNQKVVTINEQYLKNKEKFKSLIKIYENQRDNFSVLSDMCQSIMVDNSFTEKTGFGHSKRYWNKDESQIKEVFAEVAQTYAMMPKSLEYIQKYYPKTVEAFKEILGGLNSGKIKK